MDVRLRFGIRFAPVVDYSGYARWAASVVAGALGLPDASRVRVVAVRPGGAEGTDAGGTDAGGTDGEGTGGEGTDGAGTDIELRVILSPPVAVDGFDAWAAEADREVCGGFEAAVATAKLDAKGFTPLVRIGLADSSLGAAEHGPSGASTAAGGSLGPAAAAEASPQLPMPAVVLLPLASSPGEAGGTDPAFRLHPFVPRAAPAASASSTAAAVRREVEDCSARLALLPPHRNASRASNASGSANASSVDAQPRLRVRLRLLRIEVRNAETATAGRDGGGGGGSGDEAAGWARSVCTSPTQRWPHARRLGVHAAEQRHTTHTIAPPTHHPPSPAPPGSPTLPSMAAPREHARFNVSPLPSRPNPPTTRRRRGSERWCPRRQQKRQGRCRRLSAKISAPRCCSC